MNYVDHGKVAKSGAMNHGHHRSSGVENSVLGAYAQKRNYNSL